MAAIAAFAFARSALVVSASPVPEAPHRVGPDEARGDIQTLDPIATEGRLEVDLVLAGEGQRLVLEQKSLRAPGFRVLADIGGRLHEVPVPGIDTYRGRVAGSAQSRVTASVIEGGIHGVVELGTPIGEIWVIEPTNQEPLMGTGRPHFVRRRGRSDHPGICATPDPPGANGVRASRAEVPAVSAPGLLAFEIACDADYEYFVANGSSIANTTADIETVLNGVSALFERDVQITFQLKRVIVRTAEPDPYSATHIDAALAEFRREWQDHHGDVARDLAHLFSGRSFGSPLGEAYTDQVCAGQNHYSLVRSRWNLDLSRRIALSAHEIAHNFDAVHCDYAADPRCRIMCTSFEACSDGIRSFEDINIGRMRARAVRTACAAPGTPTEPTTTLPFGDNFDGAVYPPRMPDPAKWTAADLAECEYKRLKLKLGRGWHNNQTLGTVRTLPMALRGPAKVRYKINPFLAPKSQSLKIEYFDSAAFIWRNLRTIVSDATQIYTTYEDSVPPDGRGDRFAVRWSAYGTALTASYAWGIEDVSITETVERPRLSIQLTATNTVAISWQHQSSAWQLQTSTVVSSQTDAWIVIPPPYPTNIAGCLVEQTISNSTRYFRLQSVAQ